MRREWTFHRSKGRNKRILWLILIGAALFVLGFFSARPILLLFGLVS
ncbi:MAG: hypothetical protein J6B54_04130 [Clostridia bacterium]|nr:hypothetical protein [Clostridia bacterium]